MAITLRVQRRKRWYHRRLFSLLPFVVLLCGCVGPAASATHSGCPTVTQLTGEGSTFDAPLFEKLFALYPSTSCGLPVVYYAAGSGAGISQVLNQLVDFGATDAPLTDRQLASSPNGAVLHVPITLGAVAISYHLGGVTSPLRLSGAVLSSLYQGTITRWDDPALVRLNPGISLPHCLSKAG